MFFINHFLTNNNQQVIVEDVLGDGNCLCRAIAVSLQMQEEDYNIIKDEIANELESNKKFYLTACGGDIKVYEVELNRAKKKNMWMGQIHMYAFSNAVPAPEPTLVPAPA